MQPRLFLSGRVITALVMLAIFVSMSVIALGFPEQARLMPLMVGVPGSVLALIQTVVEYRVAAAEAAQAGERTTEQEGGEGQMFLWMFLFFFGLLGFGFLYAAPVLVFAFLYRGKNEPLWIAVTGAVGTWIVLYGVFEQWLQIQLFAGLVIKWLGG